MRSAPCELKVTRPRADGQPDQRVRHERAHQLIKHCLSALFVRTPFQDEALERAAHVVCDQSSGGKCRA